MRLAKKPGVPQRGTIPKPRVGTPTLGIRPAPSTDLPRRGFINRRPSGDETPSGYGNTFRRHVSQGGAALALGFEIVPRWGTKPRALRRRVAEQSRDSLDRLDAYLHGTPKRVVAPFLT